MIKIKSGDKNRNNVVGIKIPPSLRHKQIYNKQHKCLYCHTMQSKLARHLTRKHSAEEEVS